MDLHRTLTNRILQRFAAGQIPWRKPWRAGLPRSLGTGQEFRGLDLLILGCTEFTSRYWATGRDVLHWGGQVRPGERATPLVGWPETRNRDADELRADSNLAELQPGTLFAGAVFNLDQVEGLLPPDDDASHHPDFRLGVADRVGSIMPDRPEIVHARTLDPAYDPEPDRITLPHLSQFEDADDYYRALFRGLVLATGHPRRLNRSGPAGGDRTAPGSFEGLVAEFGTTFLCAFAAIPNPANPAFQATHLPGWSQALRQDTRWLVQAAAAAQLAVEYIRGKIAPSDLAGAADVHTNLSVCA